MEVSAGDQVVFESEKVGQPPRKGLVEEVISGEPLRIRVRWENDSTSIIAPSAGAARVEQAARARSTRRGPAATAGARKKRA
jgi:hypothetical protein